MTAQQDLDLEQFVRGIWDRRVLLLLTTAFGVILAALLSALTPRLWEASAILQLSQIGQVGQAGQAGSQVVEPVAKTVERTRSHEFRAAVLKRLGVREGEEGRHEILLRSSLAAEQVASTDVVRLRVRGYSRDEALECLRAVGAELSGALEKLAQPTVGRLRGQLALIDKNLERARSRLESLTELYETRAGAGAAAYFSERVLLSNSITAYSQEIRELESARLTIEEQLNPERTYPVGFLDHPWAFRATVSPRWVRNLGLSFLAGLVAGVLLAAILAIGQSSRSLARGSG